MNGVEINDVPCKIFLPERIQDRPYVVLKPSKEDGTKIMDSHRGALKAYVYDFDKKIETTIEAPEIYFSKSSTKYWGDGKPEITIPGDPHDLHIIHHLRNDDDQMKTRIVFWISPNWLLTPPLMARSRLYTGEIKNEMVKNLEFTIKDNVRLVFEKHFKDKTAKNGDLIQWSFLAACTELDIPADDTTKLKNSVLQVIDDFLLIASFAARQRTVCSGWTASDNSAYTTFYRGNYIFPENDNEKRFNDGVIDIQLFEKFMNTCYPIFLQFENKLSLRNALYSISPVTPHTIEASFLRMFSGLETLILDFRRRENIEFVLSKKDWSALRLYLEECIKNSRNPKLGNEQRKSINRKLNELNRVSLREAFEVFCEKYSVDLSDLWPIFREREVAGLVDIRNNLIHGDPFPRDLVGALFMAKEHMLCILERVIARVLHWDIEETNLNRDYLRTHFNIIKDLPSEQARISEYISDTGRTKGKIFQK